MLGIGDDRFDSPYRIRVEPVDDHEHAGRARRTRSAP